VGVETPVNQSPGPNADSNQHASRARLWLVLAAVLWSLSGAFTRVMTTDTTPVIGFSAHEPAMSPLAMAFWRVFWGGCLLLPFVQPSQVRFSWRMVPVALAFAFMNATFVASLALGSSASAVLLQYTAPFWVVLVGWLFWREKLDRATVVSLALAMSGVACLVLEGWEDGHLTAVGLALASGVGFALVLLGLGWLRDLPSAPVTVFNFLTGALVLLPVVLLQSPPTLRQLGMMALFGGLQMGLPYLIAARALRHISAREAGLITLLEPLLNPVWSRLLAPQSEPITVWMVCGALGILGALGARYWLAGTEKQTPGAPEG
jgi:drug/metabolite transporter (DMT)-like permease